MGLLHKTLGFFLSLGIIVKRCINMSHMAAPSVNVLISSRGYDPLEQVIIIVKGCSLMMCPLGQHSQVTCPHGLLPWDIGCHPRTIFHSYDKCHAQLSLRGAFSKSTQPDMGRRSRGVPTDQPSPSTWGEDPSQVNPAQHK
jgi:hypothetical protein